MRRRTAMVLGVTLLGLVAPLAQAQTNPVVVKPAGREPTLTLGGLLQVQAEVGDRGDSRFTNDNDRIYLRRARLNATGKFLEEFDFRLEMDLAGSLAATSALRAQMTDGFINWNRYRAANIKVGQFKTPFGYEQLYSDPRLPAMERSLVNDRLTVSRQLGVQVSGDILDQRLTYAIGAFNGNGVNNSGNDDDRFLMAGRLSGVLWSGKLGSQSATWSLGGDALQSKDSSISFSSEFGFDSTPATADRDGIFAGDRRGWGIDQQLKVGRFLLWAEYLRTRFEPDNARPVASFDADGAYLQGSYEIVPQRFEVLLKWEEFDPRSDREEDDVRSLTAGGTLYLKGQDLKLLLNVIRTEGPGDVEDQTKVLARLQVIF